MLPSWHMRLTPLTNDQSSSRMEAESALGRREAVVERYEQLRHELDEQFGLEPSRELKQFHRRLLGQGAAWESDDGDEPLSIPSSAQAPVS